MESVSENKKGTRRGRRIALRVIAAALAAVLLFSVVVSLLVRVVTPRQKTVSMSLVEKAYTLLSADDAYLNAPVIERVGKLFSTVGVTPSTVSDYEQLASMYIGRGNYEEAQYLYEQAAALISPEQEVALANLYYKLGSVSVLCGDLAAAETYYGRVLAYGVSSELIHVLMAQVYLEQQKYTQAAGQLALYLVYAPDDAENRALYANVLEVSGSAAAAAEQYALLYEETADAARLLDHARASMQAGAYAQAVDALTRYLETAEDTDGSLHYTRGIAALWMGDSRQAVSDLTLAEELGYADADGSLHFMRGTAHLGLGEFESGDADLLKAIELGYADMASCYLQLSLSAYAQSDYEQTVAYGQLSCENTDTPDAECLQRMGFSEMQLERYPEAMAYLEQSLERDPSLTINQYYLATLHFQNRDFEKAIAAYTAAIDGDVYAQECLYNRALCYLQLKKREEATADLLLACDAGDDREVIAAAMDILKQMGVKTP